MGRTKYSDDERAVMVKSFIRATREIIDMEGAENVTIRKVAKMTGYNSATIYLYFDDADELISLASMSYLENYCRALAADLPKISGAYEVFFHVWGVFCQYTLAYPNLFYRLFFRPHGKSLDDIVERYYRIYPKQLEHLDGTVRGMLLAGDMNKRCMEILRPLAGAGIVKEEDLEIINDLTVCYFRQLIDEQRTDEGAMNARKRTEKMLAGLKFLIDKRG